MDRLGISIYYLDVKKIVGIMILSVFLIAFQPVTANGASKSGKTCPKLGATSILAGKKYTCIKTGKRLIWDKGVVYKVSLKPTKSPSVITPSPEPISMKPTLLGNLDALLTSKSNVQEVAFFEVREKTLQANPIPLIINAQIGPNTKLTHKEYSKSLQTAHNIFKNATKPSSLDILYYTFPDLNWANDQWQTIRKNNGTTFAGNQRCTNVNSCSYATTFQGDQNSGLIVVAGSYVAPEFLGVTEIHEYTHVVQFAQMRNEPITSPMWWNEGQAMFFGVAGASKDFNSYLLLKNRQLSIWKSSPGFSFSESSISDGLLGLNQEKSQNQTVFAYSVGQAFIETLVAIKGSDLTMKVWEELALGKNFKDAFSVTYGFTLEEAVKVISPILADRFK